MSSLSFSYIDDLDIGKRSRGAAIGLLFYDILINLDREVELVWMKDKNRPAFFLYLFNSLFAFAYYVFDTIPITPSGVVASHVGLYDSFSHYYAQLLQICVIYLMCDAMVTLIATVMVQVILQLRIYALFERSRKILVFLVGLCIIEVSAMAVLVGITMSDLARLPLVSTPTGCAYQGILKAYALFWIPGLIFEPILFSLVAYKAWGSNTKIPLITQMARDSLMYFAVIFSELLTNTVIWGRYPQYINIFNPWSAIIPSLLGRRLLLSMREFVEKQNRGNSSYFLETYAPTQTSTESSGEIAWNTDSAPED
ncbi:hypothetical protein NM688_g2910 [Phlebia brevispora]|uniref:Uncharacterized protein n=1 Tax=Phlebia brevispora TaxID=194682 RepID=A0ACC1T713_9APHY|nr:hypothetical protein NM688_g2910 [Phlebia brevispora]